MSKPSIERLRELLRVNVATGQILWRKSQGRAAAGSKAGRRHIAGYLEVQADGQLLKAHAIVWLFAAGDWPERLDHINGERDDNRLANLREADAAANARNRTNWRHRKLLGAHQLPDGSFKACITSDAQVFALGTFDTEEQAHQRYKAARAAVDAAERRARLTVLEELQAERLLA